MTHNPCMLYFVTVWGEGLLFHHHHHHHLSRSCHCWQMASTTHAKHFDFEPPSSIDCYQLPRCCLSISFCLPLTRFPSVGVHSDVILAHVVLLILATCPAHCPLLHHTLISFTLVLHLISFRISSLRDV